MLGMQALPEEFYEPEEGEFRSPFLNAIIYLKYDEIKIILNKHQEAQPGYTEEHKARFQSCIDQGLWECVFTRRLFNASKMFNICTLLCAYGANPNGYTSVPEKKSDGPITTTLDLTAVTLDGILKISTPPKLICYLLSKGARGSRILDPNRAEHLNWNYLLGEHPEIKCAFAKNLIYQSNPPNLKERLIFHLVHDEPKKDISLLPEELRKPIIELRIKIHPTPLDPDDFPTLEYNDIIRDNNLIAPYLSEYYEIASRIIRNPNEYRSIVREDCYT